MLRKMVTKTMPSSDSRVIKCRAKERDELGRLISVETVQSGR